MKASVYYLCMFCLIILANPVKSNDTSTNLPPIDMRTYSIKTLDTLRQFPLIESKDQWELLAKDIILQAKVSCGLIPEPEHTSLNAKIFGKKQYDGFTVEKVYFESLPGFIVCGNLFRPLGKGNGPFPAVLNPHGHWSKGRFTDTTECSVPARCIQLARLGIISFAYDMVGYGDTKQFPEHRQIFLAPENQLWNISLMGLQTWNSIRALDFLESLPDVDKKRIACTGASGGGTQTFILGCVDDRLAAQAPVCMVSHSMQGGCLCENSPGLRVRFSNMEIAAAPAPRPQILIGATGDWTRAILEIEGPAIKQVYQTLNSEDKIKYVRLNFNHNYNKDSREIVYGWFGKWLLGYNSDEPIPESNYPQLDESDLKVFGSDNQIPTNLVSQEQLINYLIEQSKRGWKKTFPMNKSDLTNYKNFWFPVWKTIMQLDYPVNNFLLETNYVKSDGDISIMELCAGRINGNDRIPVTIRTPKNLKNPNLTVLITIPEGRKYLDQDPHSLTLIACLLSNGFKVVTFDCFSAIKKQAINAVKSRSLFTNFFTTYNRTDCQECVQDIVTISSFIRKFNNSNIALIGLKHAGPWALLASPVLDVTIADCNQFDFSKSETWLDEDLFLPGIMRINGMVGVSILAAPKPMYLFNTQNSFPSQEIIQVYSLFTSPTYIHRLFYNNHELNNSELVKWLKTFVN